MFNQQQGTKQMLPFSYQVTRYLICLAARIECSVGPADAYNSLYSLTITMWDNMDLREHNEVRSVLNLMQTIKLFAMRAAYGNLS